MSSASDLRSGKTHRDENFPVASWIIHPRHRPLILALYNFVRSADDIADHAKLPAEEKLRYLDLLDGDLRGRGDSEAEAVRLRSALAERGVAPRHALDLLSAFRTGVTKLRAADATRHRARGGDVRAAARREQAAGAAGEAYEPRWRLYHPPALCRQERRVAGGARSPERARASVDARIAHAYLRRHGRRNR